MVNNIIINLKCSLVKQITAEILHHVKNLWIIYMNNLLVTIFYLFLKAFKDYFCFTSSETSCPTLGNFSELNPIKSMWNLVKHGLIKHDCATVEKLISALIQVWYNDHELPNMYKKLQSCSWYFETFWWFSKFCFHHKWNEEWLLVVSWYIRFASRVAERPKT